ncbi:MAG: type I pullulanase [Oscillospiraceae bacterium]|nr:type I pullulanase [Oscillospiraceae bacterium]
MKSKRSIALLLALLMLCSFLTACTDTPAPKKAPAPTEEAEPAEETAGAEEAAPEEPAPEAGAEEEFFLEKEEGCRQLTLYWKHPDADYSKCDVWLWFPGKDGHGELFHPCAYGVKCMVNVPEDVEEVGFIVRRDCSKPGGSSWGDATKDYENDRFVQLTGADTVIYLQPGDGMQYLSDDSGVTLKPIRVFTLAGIISPTQIRYTISPSTKIESLSQVHVRQDGRELELEELSSLNNTVVTGVITVKEELDVSKAYTVEIEGYGEIAAMPTDMFDSPEFVENYCYDGDDLGAVIQGEQTVFKLWAPTASDVKLNLFEEGDGGEPFAVLDMEKGEKGVWSLTAPCGHGTYYTYSVTTAIGTQEAVDPYARTVGVNGDRGMVVDLRSTDPEGFRESGWYEDLDCYGDAVIWEVHVRDFSNRIAESKYPGKYLAFTETGLTNSAGLPVGLDYLKWLGVTHVHLQPVYDYATVDESSSEPQFNWGYDPKNYNAPEGSYSTDPFHGEVRVNEFKQMVQALHENGFAVVMDMVYNHTYSLDSNLNRIVPYYYYRFASDGSPANGSGCGNETASNRLMFRKYMVDSVRYWAEEYRIDGFRFDLMALHDVETMQEIEKAVHEINPKAILYGEGWTGGTTPLRDNVQASQKNIAQITASGQGIGAVAVFNDAIRDGLKGSVFDEKDSGYANGSPSKANAQKVAFGIQGGVRGTAASWGVENAMVINYTSCHDNLTLWDKLKAASPDATEEELLQMNRLCAEIVLLSKGTPFFLAGEEMLRTKGGDHNSYMSSDEVNNLDWEALTPESDAWEMANFYRELIAMRRSNEFFTKGEVTAELDPDNRIHVKWTVDGELVAWADINPTDKEVVFEPTPYDEDCEVLLGENIWTAGPCSVLIVKVKK